MVEVVTAGLTIPMTSTILTSPAAPARLARYRSTRSPCLTGPTARHRGYTVRLIWKGSAVSLWTHPAACRRNPGARSVKLCATFYRQLRQLELLVGHSGRTGALQRVQKMMQDSTQLLKSGQQQPLWSQPHVPDEDCSRFRCLAGRSPGRCSTGA